jgi:hypothetical protein
MVAQVAAGRLDLGLATRQRIGTPGLVDTARVRLVMLTDGARPQDVVYDGTCFAIPLFQIVVSAVPRRRTAERGGHGGWRDELADRVAKCLSRSGTV